MKDWNILNNEDKKQYILTHYQLSLRFHILDNTGLKFKKLKKLDDDSWCTFADKLLKFQPQYLYKYRTINEYSINDLENDTVWFSHPCDFDDTLDSSLNIDIQKELLEFEKDKNLLYKKLAIAFIFAIFRKSGVKFDVEIHEMIETLLPFYDENGKLDKIRAYGYLKKCYPMLNIKKLNEIDKMVRESISIDVENEIIKFLEKFLNINKNIKSKTFAYCLAEESDNDAMWGTYADHSKGFCIEYEIPYNTIHSQEMRMNLLPIYYGEKEEIKLFDLLIEGLSVLEKDKISEISTESYIKMYLSLYTKASQWHFQKEWRIVLGESLRENKVVFPYVKSIILGERISEENKNKLIEIAKKKKIKIFKRKYNLTQSKIVIDEIKYNE